MARHLSFRLGLLSIFVAAHLSMSVNALSQSADLALTRSEEADLDSLALHTAQKIRQAQLEEKEPHVLVIDFFRSSQGNSSRLGTLLADRFSESLSTYSAGLKVLDRNTLKDHLTKEWTTLEDLKSNDICLRIGRQLGATGVILGTLYEENGQISLTIHLEGFGPVANKTDAFKVMDERVRFPTREEMHATLFQPGPKYTRSADDIPAEPGVFRAGLQGVTSPVCIYCPQPDYSDAARVAKFQGTVRLSIVVTAEGEATSIFVTKGAPFGLTEQAIKATRGWRFRPAEKDGNPVTTRVEVETTWHLY
jgi:TonB family protein